jgi:hypothetical protein
MSSIILPSEFDIKNITYGDIKRMDNGGKIIFVGYNKSPLIIQTCECYAPFGIQCYQNDDGKTPSSYTLDLSFKNMESRKSLQKLHDVFSQLDGKNIEMGMENAMTWLNQKKIPKSSEVIEALYKPIIKVPKQEQYPSTFKVKIPFKNGSFGCDIFDKNHDLIDLTTYEENRTKGAKCTALIQCTGIYLAGSSFGMTWRCVQLKCCIQENFSGFCMKFNPEDTIVGEDIEDDNEKVNVVQKKPVAKLESVEVAEKDEKDDEDEDEEEDDDGDEDEEPLPIVVSKKKK